MMIFIAARRYVTSPLENTGVCVCFAFHVLKPVNILCFVVMVFVVQASMFNVDEIVLDNV